jgi:hypothetical protein
VAEAAAVDNAVQDTPVEPDEITDTGAEPDDDTLLLGDEPLEPPDFALKISGYLIEMNTDMTYVLAALGEPQRGVFEAPSCAFDGIDRIFGYSNMEIFTYPIGDSDFIHTISLIDDSILTTEGSIHLGSSLQDVIDAYGDGYERDSGMYKYTRGRTTLEFYIENGEVEGITYGFIIE